nr:hypothetical protein [uncultured Mediterranean phage uvMED]
MSIVKLNNQAVKNATSFGSISSLGSMTFIKKLTASSSATLSFVDGTDGVVLDDTYKEYLFTFNNIHPATNDAHLTFNMSVDTGSNYNVTKTTTYFRAYLSEDNNFQSFGYDTGYDLAQSTSFQRISGSIGSGNDENFGGTLTLFNPSSTTFVKHFISQGNTQRNAIEWSWNSFMAGYGNTTSSVNAIRFQMDSGNIDAGDICLYGIA